MRLTDHMWSFQVYNIRPLSYTYDKSWTNHFDPQASKGAVRNFYHTLRIELGAEIDIAEVIPGAIESEITKGKILTEEGRIVVDQDLRDVSSLWFCFHLLYSLNLNYLPNYIYIYLYI